MPAQRQSAAQPDAAACHVDVQQPTDSGQPTSPIQEAHTAQAAPPDQEAHVSDLEDADGSSAEDVRACLFSLLQRKCPDLRITCNALGMLEGLLNEVGHT